MGPAGIVCCVQGDYLLIGTVLTTEMNEKREKCRYINLIMWTPHKKQHCFVIEFKNQQSYTINNIIIVFIRMDKNMYFKLIFFSIQNCRLGAWVIYTHCYSDNGFLFIYNNYFDLKSDTHAQLK
jgi:hypothetical protein